MNEPAPTAALPSQFQINEGVIVTAPATVVGVTFTESKVIYVLNIAGKTVTLPSDCVSAQPVPAPLTA